MRKANLSAALILLFAGGWTTRAQDTSQRPEIYVVNTADLKTSPQRTSPLLAVPSPSGGWVLEIVTSGGFAGQRRFGSVASNGTTTCSPECGFDRRRTIQSLTERLRGAATWTWVDSVSDVCRDCVITQVYLWLREPDGSVRMFRSRWDVTTATRMDRNIRDLSELTFQ
jgi:hypothetical protein